MKLLRLFLCILLFPTVVLAAPFRLPQGGTGTDITPAKGAVITSDGEKYFGDTPYGSVVAYGAVGNGIANDTAAIQQALTAGDTLFPPGTYLINATLNVPSGRRVFGARSSFIKLADNTNLPMIQLVSVSNVTLEGLTLNGNQANQSACVGGCRGIVGSGTSTNIQILHNHIGNTRNSGIYLNATTQSLVDGNYIHDTLGESNYGEGITLLGLAGQFNVITNNRLERIGGTGIGMTGTDGVIANNTIYDSAKTVSQQAIVVGYGSPGHNTDAIRITVANNVVHTTTLHGCIRVGGTDLTIIGNIVTACGERGIALITTNDGVTRGVRLRALDNQILEPSDASAVNAGIDLGLCDGCEVSGNLVKMKTTSTANAIIVQGQTNSKISNNTLEGGNVGVRASSLTGTSITGNQLSLQKTWGMLITLNALQIPGVNADIAILNNTLTNGVPTPVGGIGISDTTATTISVVGNHIRGFGVANTIFGPYSNTYLSGNYTPDQDCSMAVASALDLNSGFMACDHLQLGAGTVNSISAGPRDRVLVLESLGTMTINDGSNLKLSGTWNANADDTLTLSSDGLGNWHEVARSAN